MKKGNDLSAGVRGATTPSPGKTRVWLYIDDDILKWFRKRIEKTNRGSYQSSINGALREFIESESLRRMMREELAPRPAGKKKRNT